jgi:hypothetical protein
MLAKPMAIKVRLIRNKARQPEILLKTFYEKCTPAAWFNGGA